MTGLLEGLTTATVVAAMWPQLPSSFIRRLLVEARNSDIEVILLVADLSGAWDFLDRAAQDDLRSGRLRVTVLAGMVPRTLAHLVGHLPVPLWELDSLIARGVLGFDLFVARVDPGSFGDMVGYSPTAIAAASRVAFEVAQPRRPPLPGTELDLTVADLRVDGGVPDRQVRGRRPPTPEQHRIARSAASLVPDGATLQLGVGALADLVAAQLVDRSDLGLHSGLLAGGAQDLLASGAATGRRKSLDVGRHVATGVIDGDPDRWGNDVLLQPISITHDPRLLLRQECLWSVNGAYQVDLAGQVNAEYVDGLRLASGAGQADFARAAHAGSGSSVMTVPSRSRDGTARIVPTLECPVTTPASDVDYVVTDHGVAELTGRTSAERAEALIAVAHPDDRAALRTARGRRRDIA